MDSESVILLLVIGFIGGRIASLAMWDLDSGILLDGAFGVGGIWIGRWVFQKVGFSTGLAPYLDLLAMSFCGAVLLFAIRSLLIRQRTKKRTRVVVYRY